MPLGLSLSYVLHAANLTPVTGLHRTHPGGDGVAIGEHANSQGPVPAFRPRSGSVFCHWPVSLYLLTVSPSHTPLARFPLPAPTSKCLWPDPAAMVVHTNSQIPCSCQVPTVGLSPALLSTPTCVSATGSCYYIGTCSRPPPLSVCTSLALVILPNPHLVLSCWA